MVKGAWINSSNKGEINNKPVNLSKSYSQNILYELSIKVKVKSYGFSHTTLITMLVITFNLFNHISFAIND